MSKPKANWPLGLSLGDLDADRVPKRAKRPAETQNAGTAKPGNATSRAAVEITETPPAKREVAPPRRLAKPAAVVPEM